MHRRGVAQGSARERDRVGLYRFRPYRRQSSCRQHGADHAPSFAPASRPSAGDIDGRRHQPGRRSVGPGGGPPADDRRTARGEPAGDPRLHRALPAVRRRTGRRDAGRQRRLARRAWLYRAASRSGAACERQPDVVVRQRQAPARARARTDVPRIQLLDPAELRFSRAAPASRRDAADGRQRPVETSSRAST